MTPIYICIWFVYKQMKGKTMQTQKRRDTTQDQLKNNCEHIANEISEGKINAYDYFDEGSILDIEWIIHNDKSYKGARVLVAFGGPNIWINTRTNEVEGYWWTDRYKAPFIDEMGIDDYLQELYEVA